MNTNRNSGLIARLRRAGTLLSALALPLFGGNAQAQGTLQVLGFNQTAQPYLLAYQTAASGWHPGFKLPSPTLPGLDRYWGLAISPAEGNTLQAVSVDSGGALYLVSWQDSGGNWHPGFKLPGASLPAGDGYMPLQEVVSQAEGNTLQVMDLDIHGVPYLVSWQDSGGNWHPGFKLPSASLPANDGFFSITATQAEGNTVQIVGLDDYGVPYLISWQDSGGNWHPGFALPSPTLPVNDGFESITITQAEGNTVQVVGLDYNGVPYLISWQDVTGYWYPGFKLPNSVPAGTKINNITTGHGADGNLQVIGTDASGNLWLIAWQAGSGTNRGTWYAGFELPSAVLPCNTPTTANTP